MSMFSKQSFALTMRTRRKRLGISMITMSDRIGVSRKTLSAWESPDTHLMPRKFDTLSAWCAELDITLSEAFEQRILPDDEFLRDPEHLKGIRVFYNRYMVDEGFAKMIHRLHHMDSQSLASLSALINQLAGQVDLHEVQKMDSRWIDAVATAELKGELPRPAYREGH